MRRLRRDALNPEYLEDSSAVCAMGVVRAVGKFLKHLARSTRPEPLGTNHRPAVVEALGDMLAYCCGIEGDAGDPTAGDMYNCGACVAEVLRSAAELLYGVRSPRRLLKTVRTLCRTCAVDPEEAFLVSLEKMRCSRS